jgi:glucose/arabinose dehydrogenase
MLLLAMLPALVATGCGRGPEPPVAATPAAAAPPATAVPAVAAAEPPADLGTGLPLDTLKLPPGFRLRVWAKDLPGARSLCRGAQGTLFVGTRGEGRVYAVTGEVDGPAGRSYVLASGRDQPNGVAFRNGSLYVAETSRIIRFDDIEQRLADPPRPQLVYDHLPVSGGHVWKYLSFGPDGKLYFNVGAPCNVCLPPGPLYETICRINPDRTGLEVYARGVRMSVGQDWDPATGDLWFTDNGRDYLGDDAPADELNHAPRAGMHFGFPYCHGGDLPDPEFGAGHPCSDYTPPALKLPAHVAPLGMKFYTGQLFPEKYRGGLFIAEHGSWNRTVPIGYRVTFVPMRNGRPGPEEAFCEGWLQGAEAWGRPVDVLVTPRGALLVSDDQAGVIYRITYEG